MARRCGWEFWGLGGRSVGALRVETGVGGVDDFFFFFFLIEEDMKVRYDEFKFPGSPCRLTNVSNSFAALYTKI